VAFGATSLRLDIHATIQQQGTIFLTLYVGVLLANLMIGPLVAAFGRKQMLLLSNAMLIAALLSFPHLHSVLTAAAAAIVLGWGGGAMNVAVNALVSDIYPTNRPARLNLLGVFFGFGALCSPLLSGAAKDLTVERFFDISLIVPVCSLILTCLLRLAPASPPTELAAARHLFRDMRSAITLIAAILFFENGNEAVIASWTSTIILTRGFLPRTATATLTAYWASLMLGRLLAAKFGSRLPRRRFVSGCAVVTVLGCLTFWRATGIAQLCVSVILIGLFSAPIFKTALGAAGDLHKHVAAKLYGPLFAVSLIAAAGAPWIAGHMAQTFTPSTVPLLPLAGGAMILVLSFGLPEASHQRSSSDRSALRSSTQLTL
jgi:fucose permease